MFENPDEVSSYSGGTKPPIYQRSATTPAVENVSGLDRMRAYVRKKIFPLALRADYTIMGIRIVSHCAVLSALDITSLLRY